MKYHKRQFVLKKREAQFICDVLGTTSGVDIDKQFRGNSAYMYGSYSRGEIADLQFNLWCAFRERFNLVQPKRFKS